MIPSLDDGPYRDNTEESLYEELVAHRPPPLTPHELRSKLSRLKAAVRLLNCNGVHLVQEGAMRWLTGLRHSVIDIDPAAESPVSAVVRFDNTCVRIQIVGKAFELTRAVPEIKTRFSMCPEIELSYATEVELPASVLIPRMPEYRSTVLSAVAPVAPTEDDNQIRKTEWLAKLSRLVLSYVLRHASVGTTGWVIRGEVLKRLSEACVECNEVLVGVSGQENFLHPVVNDGYRIEAGSFAKVAIGARYYDALYSITATAKYGTPLTKYEKRSESAMMAAALGYASRFRTGTRESDLYAAVHKVFQDVEDGFQVAAFADSAYYHHLGGPLSALGNRDYLISKDGRNTIGAYHMFSINPVHRETGIKIELQGITGTDGEEPRIIDEVSEGIPFENFSTESGKTVRVPSILTVE